MSSPFDISLQPGYSQSGQAYPFVNPNLHNPASDAMMQELIQYRAAQGEPQRLNVTGQPGWFSSGRPTSELLSDRERSAAARNMMTEQRIKNVLASNPLPSPPNALLGSVLGRRPRSRAPL